MERLSQYHYDVEARRRVDYWFDVYCDTYRKYLLGWPEYRDHLPVAGRIFLGFAGCNA